MEATIDKIYKILHGNIVTPYNLIENSKLDNYAYVKYHKKNDTLVTEMECVCEDGAKRKFFYEFNLEDVLLKITSLDSDGRDEVVFDRERELEELLQQYRLEKNFRLSRGAV